MLSSKVLQKLFREKKNITKWKNNNFVNFTQPAQKQINGFFFLFVCLFDFNRGKLFFFFTFFF